MEDALRSPLEQLESEAIYLIRETAALFDKPAILLTDDRRSSVLAKLAGKAFATESPRLPTVVTVDGEHDAYLCSDAGANFEVWPLFGKPPKSQEPWRIFPLSSWSDDDIAIYNGDQNPHGHGGMLRLCTVGELESGKSTIVEALIASNGVQAPDHEVSAHRHVVTPNRRLFVIDPPGQDPSSHGLMAAASAAEVALLVIEAPTGLTTTGKRQAFLLALMGVPHLVVVINKMDKVDFSQEVYENILSEFRSLSSLVEIKNLSFVPISALHGDNVTETSSRMPWHEGQAPLLAHLEAITPGSIKNLTDLRLPVQSVHRTSGATIIGGRLASGRLAIDDSIIVLPSGQEGRVVSLQRSQQEQSTAFAGDSVTFAVEGELEVDWGDMVVGPQGLPTRSSEIEAVMLWLGEDDQQTETTYLLHHGTRLVNAHVSEVLSTLQPESLSWHPGVPLSRGEIARVRLTTAAPLYFDSYTSNRETGAFAVLDAQSRSVLGTGVLRGPALDLPDVTAAAERLKSANVVQDPTLVGLERRRDSYGHLPAVLWFTGLSGSGKSTVAKEVEKRLFERGCHTLFLDGDNVRTGLNGDLGFTEEARTESTRRVGELASLAYEQGQIVVCSFISGKIADRAFVESLIPEGGYLEFYVSTPVDVCRSRDPKKLYEKADAGELLSFSGISIPYEEPVAPALILPTHEEKNEVLAARVLELLESRGIIEAAPH